MTVTAVPNVTTRFQRDLDRSGYRDPGVVACDQTRTVDAWTRSFRRIERASAVVIEEALDALRCILE